MVKRQWWLRLHNGCCPLAQRTGQRRESWFRTSQANQALSIAVVRSIRTRTFLWRGGAAPQKCPNQYDYRYKGQASGFTLLEILIVMLIISILLLIAAPGWNSLLTRQQLNVAQSDVHQIISQAQREAIHRRVPWQASFRQAGNQVEWASHAVSLPPAQATWQTLTSDVKIDTAETTFPKAGGVYRMRFNYQGHVNGQLGRLTFAGRNGGRLKRCVFVSTLLGTLRDAGNREQPDQGGRYCY